MPRTIQEVLDYQDELADKFENFDPDLGDERPIEEYLEARRQTVANAKRSAVEPPGIASSRS